MTSMLTKLVTLLNGTDAESADATGADGRSPGDSRPDSRLYHCPDCDTTYISREMDACPACEQAVDGIPNEADLGMR